MVNIKFTSIKNYPMKNSKIEASFENRILSVRFLNGATIEDTDLQEIYEFGNQNANGLSYGIIFEPEDHYTVTEDAIDYISDNPYNKNIIAKAYVVNTKEAEVKTRMHVLFDHPSLKPFTFKTLSEGRSWLQGEISKK
jgi:hypothetical protein